MLSIASHIPSALGSPLEGVVPGKSVFFVKGGAVPHSSPVWVLVCATWLIFPDCNNSAHMLCTSCSSPNELSVSFNDVLPDTAQRDNDYLTMSIQSRTQASHLVNTRIHIIGKQMQGQWVTHLCGFSGCFLLTQTFLFQNITNRSLY